MLIIDVKNARAAAWHASYGAVPLNDKPLTLILPLATPERELGGAGQFLDVHLAMSLALGVRSVGSLRSLPRSFGDLRVDNRVAADGGDFSAALPRNRDRGRCYCPTIAGRSMPENQNWTPSCSPMLLPRLV